jgi:outer membrane lipoprotein SlyB
MKHNLLALAALAGAAALPLAGCTQYGDGYGSSYASGYGPAPDSPWYADQYYRDDSRYHERRLRDNDRIYVGNDGRYYCRRSDGTAGLVVGGIAGGVLGNIIAPGGSKTLGTLLGAAGGAVAGSAVDRNNVRCR